MVDARRLVRRLLPGAKNFFPKYPVDSAGVVRGVSRIRASIRRSSKQFARTRTGAVAPAALAAKYGWHVGDKIPIEADIYPKKDGSRLWEFELVGTYDRRRMRIAPERRCSCSTTTTSTRRGSSAQGQVGWFVVRVADPAKAAEVARSIDKLFENSPNETRTATEAEFARQFANQIGNIGLMMGGILGAVFFTIMLLTGNTMAQAFRERVPELAVLKTLGFTDALRVAAGARRSGAACASSAARSASASRRCSRRASRDGIKDILPGFRNGLADGRCWASPLRC